MSHWLVPVNTINMPMVVWLLKSELSHLSLSQTQIIALIAKKPLIKKMVHRHVPSQLQ